MDEMMKQHFFPLQIETTLQSADTIQANLSLGSAKSGVFVINFHVSKFLQVNLHTF